jgi:tetratricopeptide (TPR) repeat protein
MMYEIFFSYPSADEDEVMPICSALRAAGLDVWIDKTEVKDGASITRSIVEGLAKSKVLLAYYSQNYPRSRACQWELTAAFLASQREGGGRPERRIRIIKPKEVHVEIHPVELRDALYHRVSVPVSPDEISGIVESVKAHVDEITSVFGEIRALKPPVWYGRRGVGYSRFVGRLSYLWQIHSALHASEYSVITGTPAASSVDYVHGMGGVGKSLLAEEYALRYGAAFPGGVFWLSAFGNDDSETGMGADEREAEREGQIRQIASALEIPVDGRSPEEIEGSLLVELGKRGEPCLWVVDDLPSGMDEGTVQRWLAPHPLGKTLITTRSHEYDSLGSQVRLDVLLPDEAYELLTMRREPVGAEEEASAMGIVKDLGYHALAAAIHASSAVLPFADFKKELAISTSADDVLEFAVEFADTLPHGHEASIASTFLRSIDRLEPEGLDFLRLASRLAVAPIPDSLVSSVFCEVDGLDERSGRRRANLAVRKAERLSLAEGVEGGAGVWSVHTLISRTMRFRDPKPERSEELQDAAVSVLTTAFRENAKDPRDHAKLEPVVAHARELVDRAEDHKTADLADWVARYDRELDQRELETRRRGELENARKIQEEVLETRRRVLGDEHPGTLLSMDNLAGTLRAQGELVGAREIQAEVLETRRRVLGDEHLDTLASMNNLAGTLSNQGEFGGARKIQEKVLETIRRVLGSEHPGTLASMNNLAGTLRAQGELENARKIQEEVLETIRRVLGSEHPGTLASMNNLALTLKAQGDLAGARKIQEEVFETTRRILGAEHPDTLTMMSNLAETLQAQGKLENARKIQEEVLEISRRVLVSEHPDTLRSLNNLATTLQAQGDLEKARKIQEGVLETRRRVLGSEHPDTSISAWNLFYTLHGMSDSDRARTVLETDLLWLLDRDPASLGADQRRIREQVKEAIG